MVRFQAPNPTNELNHHPPTAALGVWADNIEHLISSWILFRKSRSSALAPSIPDLLSDEEWVRKAQFCGEGSSIETQIRKAAWRAAIEAIQSTFKGAIARYNIRRRFVRRNDTA